MADLVRNWSDDDKKVLEGRLLDAFMVLTPVPFTVVQRGRDEPDAIILHDGEQKGLEITQLTDEGIKAAHAQGRMTDELLAAVRATGQPLQVLMYTRTNFDGSGAKGWRKTFVSRVRRVIEEAANVRSKVRVEYGDRDCLRFGFPELQTLHISEMDPVLPPCVQLNSLLSYSGGDQQLVRERLREKEAKLPRYKRNTGLEKHWLLMVTGIAGAQPVVADMVGPMDPTTGYEHVYLMDVSYDRVERVAGWGGHG